MANRSRLKIYLFTSAFLTTFWHLFWFGPPGPKTFCWSLPRDPRLRPSCLSPWIRRPSGTRSRRLWGKIFFHNFYLLQLANLGHNFYLPALGIKVIKPHLSPTFGKTRPFILWTPHLLRWHPCGLRQARDCLDLVGLRARSDSLSGPGAHFFEFFLILSGPGAQPKVLGSGRSERRFHPFLAINAGAHMWFICKCWKMGQWVWGRDGIWYLLEWVCWLSSSSVCCNLFTYKNYLAVKSGDTKHEANSWKSEARKNNCKDVK